MVGKFKGKEKRDVSVLISNTLMSHLMFGYESRVHNLMEMLRVLEGRDQLEVSICCEAPFKPNPKNKDNFLCLACARICQPKMVDKEKILDIKLGIVEQLREEDKALVDFAQKMGYTAKKEFPPATQVKQNNLIILGENQRTEVMREVEHLPPLERDTLIEHLTRKITDIEIIESTQAEEKKDEQPKSI